jgi:natural product precursor
MKKLSRLKLIQFDKEELEARQKNVLKGGGSGYCYCTCSGCSCESWDGSGYMPRSQSSSDVFTGSLSASGAANKLSNFG